MHEAIAGKIDRTPSGAVCSPWELVHRCQYSVIGHCQLHLSECLDKDIELLQVRMDEWRVIEKILASPWMCVPSMCKSECGWYVPHNGIVWIILWYHNNCVHVCVCVASCHWSKSLSSLTCIYMYTLSVDHDINMYINTDTDRHTRTHIHNRHVNTVHTHYYTQPYRWEGSHRQFVTVSPTTGNCKLTPVMYSTYT